VVKKNWIEQAEENGEDICALFEKAHEVPVQLAAQYRALIEAAAAFTLAQQLDLIKELHGEPQWYWVVTVDGQQLLVVRDTNEKLQVYDRSNLFKTPWSPMLLETVLMTYGREE